MFQDKGKNKVNNDRRTEGEEGEINKIQADGGDFHSHFFTQPGAHTEDLEFKE